MLSTLDNNLPDPSRSARHNQLIVDVIIDAALAVQPDAELIVRAVQAAAAAREFSVGQVTVRVTDDGTIHQLNRQFMNHDYPTDVISFPYECQQPLVVGEMVVSLDTAMTQAKQLGWAWQHELCLYVVHGTLHLTGMEDTQPKPRQQMRQFEQRAMQELGIDEIHRFGADSIATAEEQR